MVGLVELFCAYPPQVVEGLLSPISGIPGKFKFMPTIAEIKEILDARTPDQSYARMVAAQLRDRQQQIAGPVYPKPTYDELKAKHGENWGLKTVTAEKKKSFLSLGELAAKYDVDPSEVQNLPDRQQGAA